VAVPPLPANQMETTGFPGRGIAPGSHHQMMLAVQDKQALRTMYATGPSLDMLGEWADKILSHLPVAEAPEPPAVVPAQPGGQLW
jgi:hypothetical protein